MKIQGVNPINKHQPIGKAREEQKGKKDKPLPQAAEYLPGEKQEKISYQRPGPGGDKVDIGKLRQESEKAHQTLRQLVEKLILRQGYTVQQVEQGEIHQLKVDDKARQEAANLIADDGPLGAEAVSDRIVQFAIGLSGGDPDKLETLRGAIDAGFQAVKGLLGELPPVSQKTYQLIMEKLDAYMGEKEN